MANAREIKLRIKGINETKKITKAMKLISASKLKKAKAMHEATMPFFRKVQDIMTDILAHKPDIETVYFDKRENKKNRKVGYIVVASDKGLNGGFNHNIIKLADSIIDKKNSVVFPIGNVVLNHVLKEGYEVIIAGAGLAAHLPGVIASMTVLPVVGVPLECVTPSSNGLGGMDALLSIVQMPKQIPVATVGINNAGNAAYLALEILGIKYPELQCKLKEFRAKLIEEAAEKGGSGVEI